MVAKINHGSSLYGALSYNQEKVNEGLGKVLGTNLVMEPADGKFSIGASMADFERLMPSHFRTKKPVMHVSLNPHPDDKLTDAQLSDIGREYMQQLGYGGQPYMIFKHQDIGRDHIHIVASRVQTDGKLVPDRFEKDRSTKIVTDLEREFNLILAKGQAQGEAWQLSPVDAQAGNLKKQVSNVIKPLHSMYRFSSFGEYRALLSIYNIRIEEMRGVNAGGEYKGLVYSVLDKDGVRVGKPLKSSLFGKPYGIDGLEKHYEKSKTTIKAEGCSARTRALVAASLATARTGSELRADLQGKGIDLVLRYNEGGRLIGAAYIDHNDRAVLNGSALGKEFSANKLAERFADFSQREDLHVPSSPAPLQPDTARKPSAPAPSGQVVTDAASQSDHSGDPLGGMLSVLTPETHTDDNQAVPAPRRKKKRWYGQQL
jgi:hypothetical protein